MKFNEILRAALKETNTTQTRLGEMAGVRQSTVGNTLARTDIFMSTFVKWLDKLGYDVIIVPRDSNSPTMKLTTEEE